MKLGELLRDLPEEVSGLPDLTIEALAADSRSVREGGLFFAIRGTQADGHRYIEDAITRGARAVIGEAALAGLPVPYIRVSDSRRALGLLASTWHGHPSRELVLIGVTGTDGKTTTVNLLSQLLMTAGIEVGMITSVNARIGEQELDTGFHVTTPDPLELQALLASMVRAGLTHCVLETTSHGLAQHRVAGCDFDIGVVTNITHEHLDYHGDVEAYRQAKARLFKLISIGKPKSFFSGRSAVLNRDDGSFDFLKTITEVQVFSYGRQSQADFMARDIRADLDGVRFELTGPGFRSQVASKLLGEFNVGNMLAASAAALGSLGMDPAVLEPGLTGFSGVPGRMERVDLGQSFLAMVDFAHTPNALSQALKTARALTQGKLIAVFGSAGLRDRAKRQMMAEVSTDLADLTILTAEDPRTESVGSILAAMAQGALERGGQEQVSFLRIPDRGEAIRQALAHASPGDLVILCGKGHEQSMCFGETEYPWDDRTALRAALAEYLGIDGPEMPELPTSKA